MNTTVLPFTKYNYYLIENDVINKKVEFFSGYQGFGH